MERKFTVKGQNATAILGYTETGLISQIELLNNEDQAIAEWLLGWAPIRIENLLTYISNPNPRLAVREILDVTFDGFWNLYDHKVGNKARCEKAWNALRDNEKVACLQKVPVYSKWIKQQPGTMIKVYPETFITQRRWENEFK